MSTPTTRVSSLSVFFPAYNEAENLPTLIAEADSILRQQADEYEIIVVNDGSRDATATVLQELQTRYPCMRVITHEQNQGYGAAVRSGLSAARFELVFFADADQQFCLAEISTLLEKISQADVVIGYRQSRQDHAGRRLAGWLWTSLVCWGFGVRFRDLDCAFKLMKRSALERINIQKLQSNSSTLSPELLIKFERAGLRIVEVPVTHYARQHGSAKGVTPSVIIRSLRELALIYRELRGR